MSAIFEIENLRVAYNGDAVLHGVTVSLERGSIVGIVGESGCGKTTLLRAALGMLGQRHPTLHSLILLAMPMV